MISCNLAPCKGACKIFASVSSLYLASTLQLESWFRYKSSPLYRHEPTCYKIKIHASYSRVVDQANGNMSIPFNKYTQLTSEPYAQEL